VASAMALAAITRVARLKILISPPLQMQNVECSIQNEF
jgi:hypothetical protein